MLSQLLVAHIVGTYFASSTGFVLIALGEFLFCGTEMQEEKLACTPPFRATKSGAAGSQRDYVALLSCPGTGRHGQVFRAKEVCGTHP